MGRSETSSLKQSYYWVSSHSIASAGGCTSTSIAKCVWGGADEIHVLWWKSSWWVSTFRFVCTHCILSTGLKSNNDQVWGGGGGGGVRVEGG